MAKSPYSLTGDLYFTMKTKYFFKLFNTVLVTAVACSSIALAEVEETSEVPPTEKNSEQSCQCPEEKPSIEAAADLATVIVLGSVQDIKNDPLKPGFNKVEIKPLRKVKGYEEFSPSKIVIYTEKGQCGFDFQVAGDYLIYANGSLAKLKVDRCGRTAYFVHSREELTKVDELLNYEIVEEEVIEKVAPKKPKPVKKPIGKPSHIGAF